MKHPDAELDLYYGTLPGERRDALLAIRKMIRRIWPEVTEDMAYGMPTFHLGGVLLCAIASQKYFITFHVIPYDLLVHFKNDLKVYDHGKSCIRFRKLLPETYDLLDRIIKYTGNQLELSHTVARPSGHRKQLVRS